MSKKATAWVVSDQPDRMPELLAGAASLADNVIALVIGSQDDANAALAHGAKEVFLAPARDDLIFEDYAPSFVAAIQAKGPALVLLPATRRCKALAARLGVGLDAAVINEAAQIALDGAATRVSHMVYGGLAQGLENVSSPNIVLTVGSGVFEAAAPGAGSGAVSALTVTPPAKPIRRVARQPKQGSQVDLGKARRVVSVGRGLGSKDALGVVSQLASALEAEMGCSRPVAEGEGWMERERYIGVSGVMLKADLYFALGISGQIQHMVGANASKVIVAINKDKNAPIFQNCDYGLVGDLHKVIPALTAALK